MAGESSLRACVSSQTRAGHPRHTSDTIHQTIPAQMPIQMDLDLTAETGTLATRIASALAKRMANGALGAGERLPSVRRLADRLAVSPFTIVAAYDRLVADGLVLARAKSGFFVAPRQQGARPSDPRSPGRAGRVECQNGRQPDLDDAPVAHARSAATQARLRLAAAGLAAGGGLAQCIASAGARARNRPSRIRRALGLSAASRSPRTAHERIGNTGRP